MTRVFIWKNNSPQEWEEISFSAFSKARRNGCFTGRFFVETVKMFRDEDDRIIMECSRKDFEKYQQEDRHSRYLQEHEKSRSIFPASHVGDAGQFHYKKVDGTPPGEKWRHTTMSVPEMADLLGLKSGTAYDLVKRGYFETTLIDRRIRIITSSFEAWYQKQTHYVKISERSNENGIYREA